MRFCLEPVNVSFKYVNNNQDYNIQQKKKLCAFSDRNGFQKMNTMGDFAYFANCFSIFFAIFPIHPEINRGMVKRQKSIFVPFISFSSQFWTKIIWILLSVEKQWHLLACNQLLFYPYCHMGRSCSSETWEVLPVCIYLTYIFNIYNATAIWFGI